MRRMFIAVSVLTLVACGANTNPIATYAGRTTEQAGAGGVLVREGSCLYLASGSSGARTLLALPDGAAAWEDGALVIDGRRFREGDFLGVGGGEWNEAMHNWVRPPDDSCDLTNVWRVGGIG